MLQNRHERIMKPTKLTRKLCLFLIRLELKPAHLGIIPEGLCTGMEVWSYTVSLEINSHLVGKESGNCWLLLDYGRIAPNISKEDNLAFKCKGHNAAQAFMTIVDPRFNGVQYDAWTKTSANVDSHSDALLDVVIH